MRFVIRKAEKKDMERVLELIKELAIFEREPEAVEVTIEQLQHDGFSNNPAFFCLVAEVNNIIEGIALFYYRYSTWKGIALQRCVYQGVGSLWPNPVGTPRMGFRKK